MGFIQNRTILIPSYITKYCLYTIHFMLLTSVVSFYLNYKFLSFLFLMLYVIGILYWTRPSLHTIRRKLDLFTIIFSFSYLTYIVCKRFTPFYISNADFIGKNIIL